MSVAREKGDMRIPIHSELKVFEDTHAFRIKDFMRMPMQSESMILLRVRESSFLKRKSQYIRLEFDTTGNIYRIAVRVVFILARKLNIGSTV